MQFSIKVNQLLPALNLASQVVERNSPTPAFRMMLFQPKDSTHVHLFAGNGELEFIQELSGLEISGEESFLFPVYELLQICRNSGENGELSAKMSENKLTVTLGDNQYYLNTLAAEQFPHIQQKTDDVVLSIRQGDMKYLLKKTAFSMAQNNAQYALNGLLVETSQEKLCAVATDSHRLALCQIPLSPEQHAIDGRYILPQKSVLFLEKILEDIDETATISANPRFICFDLGNKKLVTNLIDGQYPEYRTLFASKFSSVILLESEKLKYLLDATSVFEQVEDVKLVFDSKAMLAIRENTTGEKAEAKADLEFNGETLALAFTAKYLQDVLSVVETDKISFNIKDLNSGVQITEHGSDFAQFIVMPRRI